MEALDWYDKGFRNGFQQGLNWAAQEVKEAQNSSAESPCNSESAPCQHKWTYGMFNNICAKCGLVDDA